MKLWDTDAAKVIGRLHAERSAEERGERVAGSPSRSFAAIAGSSTRFDLSHWDVARRDMAVIVDRMLSAIRRDAADNPSRNYEREIASLLEWRGSLT